MSERSTRFTTRELRTRLKELGCVFVRQTGSHEIWRMADGTTLPPLVNHGDNVIVFARSIKIFLAQRGVKL